MALDNWKEELQVNMIAATHLPDPSELLRWISCCWDPNFQLRDLADSRPFQIVDQCLATSMIKMMEGAKDRGRTLLSEIEMQKSRCLREGRLLPGRQIIKKFLDTFETIDGEMILFDYAHLERLRVERNDYEGFRNN